LRNSLCVFLCEERQTLVLKWVLYKPWGWNQAFSRTAIWCWFYVCILGAHVWCWSANYNQGSEFRQELCIGMCTCSRLFAYPAGGQCSCVSDCCQTQPGMYEIDALLFLRVLGLLHRRPIFTDLCCVGMSILYMDMSIWFRQNEGRHYFTMAPESWVWRRHSSTLTIDSCVSLTVEEDLGNWAYILGLAG